MENDRYMFRGGHAIFVVRGYALIHLSNRKNHVVSLQELARAEFYRVQPMADRIGITSRYLNVLYDRDLGISAKSWLRQLRFTDAVRHWTALRDMDEVTRMTGLSHRRELHRELTYFSGMPWREFLVLVEQNSFPVG